MAEIHYNLEVSGSINEKGVELRPNVRKTSEQINYILTSRAQLFLYQMKYSHQQYITNLYDHGHERLHYGSMCNSESV